VNPDLFDLFNDAFAKSFAQVPCSKNPEPISPAVDHNTADGASYTEVPK
jgi:hypothetical protein